ncbi:hypothetical protein B0H16DRAFT_241931 [Mycena metata]|uniref:Uncharacterized protein n=1 Tax=Mycena metata TaxID=1033252 RepID=A0AAD7HVU7_9AGAR|nr:hypothetical protein B0H16DRAFT_241931 [Mycena metata]
MDSMATTICIPTPDADGRPRLHEPTRDAIEQHRPAGSVLVPIPVFALGRKPPPTTPSPTAKGARGCLSTDSDMRTPTARLPPALSAEDERAQTLPLLPITTQRSSPADSARDPTCTPVHLSITSTTKGHALISTNLLLCSQRAHPLPRCPHFPFAAPDPDPDPIPVCSPHRPAAQMLTAREMRNAIYHRKLVAVPTPKPCYLTSTAGEQVWHKHRAPPPLQARLRPAQGRAQDPRPRHLRPTPSSEMRLCVPHWSHKGSAVLYPPPTSSTPVPSRTCTQNPRHARCTSASPFHHTRRIHRPTHA